MNFDNYPVSLPPRYIFNDNQIDVSRFETASSGRYPSVRVRSNGRLSRQFPVKLHALLCSGKYEDIISWQPTGRSFIIYSPKEFVKSVMPKYFRQTKLRSFQRQLNLLQKEPILEVITIQSFYAGRRIFAKKCHVFLSNVNLGLSGLFPMNPPAFRLRRLFFHVYHHL